MCIDLLSVFLQMAARIDNEHDEILYVRKLNRQFGGFKTSFLIRQLNELEKEMLTCSCCRGIMRSAVMCGDIMTCYNCTDAVLPWSMSPIRKVIDNLEITCPIERQCNWRGKISGVEAHLSVCGYWKVPCPLECYDKVFRKNIKQHRDNICMNRIVSCVFCNRIIVCKLLTVHKNSVCSKFPVDCTNLCGLKPPRGSLREHLDADCPLTEIQCPYRELGCGTATIKRKDLKDHERELYLEHQRLLLKRTKEQSLNNWVAIVIVVIICIFISMLLNR